MTLTLGQTRLRVHPVLPLLWGVCWASGQGNRLLSMLAALALHEGGHIAAAWALKIPIQALEITPLGGVMTLPELDRASPLGRGLLALAGPAASLLGVLAAPLLYRQGLASYPFAAGLAQGSLALLLVNLLPALPLDGGQALRALLGVFLPEGAVVKGLTLSASVVGAALCALSAAAAIQGKALLGPAFAGLYLLYAAALERRNGPARYVTALIARRPRLQREGALPVEAVAAGAHTPVRALLGKLRPGKYHVIFVLAPDGMTLLGTVKEKEFCEALLSRGEAPLSSLLARRESGLPMVKESAKAP